MGFKNWIKNVYGIVQLHFRATTKSFLEILSHQTVIYICNLSFNIFIILFAQKKVFNNLQAQENCINFLKTILPHTTTTTTTRQLFIYLFIYLWCAMSVKNEIYLPFYQLQSLNPYLFRSFMEEVIFE